MHDKNKKLKGYTKRELIEEISYETNIHKTVVKIVIEKLIDIAVEQVVNNRKFNLRGLITFIPFYDHGGKVMPNGSIVNPQYRLKASISQQVKFLQKLQNTVLSDKPFIINRDTWRGALKWGDEGKHKKYYKDIQDERKPSSDNQNIPKEKVDNFKEKENNYVDISNPLLDDD